MKGGAEGIVANIWNTLALTVLHAPAALNLHWSIQAQTGWGRKFLTDHIYFFVTFSIFQLFFSKWFAVKSCYFHIFSRKIRWWIINGTHKNYIARPTERQSLLGHPVEAVCPLGSPFILCMGVRSHFQGTLRSTNEQHHTGITATESSFMTGCFLQSLLLKAGWVSIHSCIYRLPLLPKIKFCSQSPA